MTDNLIIEAGDKFALIAIPRLPLDAFSLPSEEKLASGLWFSQRPPFALQEHWPRWIGSVRAKQLSEAQLCLVAKMQSETPDVMDAENQTLQDLVLRFYQGLILAAEFWTEGETVLITGTQYKDRTNIRQIGSLRSPALINGYKTPLISKSDLKSAAKLVPVLSEFPSGSYLRLCRVLNAFSRGIEDRDPRERLHQFCRCIEGLIFPDAGKTTSQFKSRTELFVGPKRHELMGLLYENRSAFEHLNDPILRSTTLEEKEMEFKGLVNISEKIARYCILNVLTKPTLLTVFSSDDQLAKFWSTTNLDRKTRWGDVITLY